MHRASFRTAKVGHFYIYAKDFLKKFNFVNDLDGMDVNLLAILLKEVILEHDKVAFGPLGSFMAELMPASVSDRGTVINPPYRRLYYRHNEKSGDTLLLDAFARHEGLSREMASEQLAAFIRAFRDELNREKTLVIPGIGRMRANASNEYFLIADRDLDIYPDGYGLGPINMKVIRKDEPEDPAPEAASASEAPEAPIPAVTLELDEEPVPQPVPEPQSEPAPEADPAPESDSAPEPDSASAPEPESELPEDALPYDTLEEDERRGSHTALWITLAVALAAVAFCAAVYIFRDAPWVWRLLYSAEELELLGR